MPDDPGPTGEPRLGTASGLGPSTPPQTRSALFDAFRREFPTAVDFDQGSFQAERGGSEVIYLAVTSSGPDSVSIGSLRAEHRPLYNSRC